MKYFFKIIWVALKDILKILKILWSITPLLKEHPFNLTRKKRKILLQHFSFHSDSMKAKFANRGTSGLRRVAQRSGSHSSLLTKDCKNPPKAKTAERVVICPHHQSQPLPANSNPHPGGGAFPTERCSPLLQACQAFSSQPPALSHSRTGSLASAFQPKERGAKSLVLCPRPWLGTRKDSTSPARPEKVGKVEQRTLICWSIYSSEWGKE